MTTTGDYANGLVKLNVADGLATVTLNRIDKANALNGVMLTGLRDLFLMLHDARDVHAVVVTGNGERSFCAGADLNEIGTVRNSDLWNEMGDALVALPVLTLALLNGPCIGGGLTLALGCDIRIGVPHVQFGYPVLRNGVLPRRHDAQRLNALIGPGRAATIFLGDSRVNAEEALQWGLVDRIVDVGALVQTGTALCQAALAADRDHLMAMKQRTR